MSKPLEARPEQKQPLTADALLEKGKIESLVQSGRIPSVIPCRLGNEAKGLVIIPPEGTQFGDKVTRIMGGGYRFESPEGKFRGLAELIFVNNNQILPIHERTTKALDEYSQKPAEPGK